MCIGINPPSGYLRYFMMRPRIGVPEAYNHRDVMYRYYRVLMQTLRNGHVRSIDIMVTVLEKKHLHSKLTSDPLLHSA